MTLALGSVVLAACAGAGSPPTAAPTTSTAPPVTTTTAPGAPCPLTDTPSPTGAVPDRPALAVKVDNYPSARPQSGLDHADIVFEEPVEGAITRYAAIFQCQGAPLVGPVRSARNIDIGILGQLGAPLLVHVGGIAPVIANIEASPIINLDLGIYSGAAQHPAGRVAPYDTYASTAALWALRPTDTAVPAPLFTYSVLPPAGVPATTIHIPYSQTSNVYWHYNATAGVYERFYGNQVDTLADGMVDAASTVAVQFVQIFLGPWAENSTGAQEVQATLYGTSGRAEVFRNGVEIAGTWTRATLAQPTQFLDAQGQPIAFKPGQTWVELVPTYITVTTSP